MPRTRSQRGHRTAHWHSARWQQCLHHPREAAACLIRQPALRGTSHVHNENYPHLSVAALTPMAKCTPSSTRPMNCILEQPNGQGRSRNAPDPRLVA